MEELQNKIEKLFALHKSALNDLEDIDENNFLEKFSRAKNSQIAAKFLKNELLFDYGKPKLQKYEQELVSLAKEIKIIYDDIVTERHSQLLIAAAELKSIQNHRKIMVYER